MCTDEQGIHKFKTHGHKQKFECHYVVFEPLNIEIQ